MNERTVVLVSEFDKFVSETDQHADKPDDVRMDVALYGLVGEIGSVVSAIKKRFVDEAGAENLGQANDEIIEELGDVIWYGFRFARALSKGRATSIFKRDIANLKKEIGGNDDRAQTIHRVLDRSAKDRFLEAAEKFPNTRNMCFSDYQELAILTARTKDRQLLEVCLAVLWQLGAELLRHKLPEIERELNKQVADRNPNDVLGEIAWHIAAIASIYKLSLDDVAAKNMEKVSFRRPKGNKPTSLHDEGYDPSQQFPRRFEIAFLTIAPRKSRMYFNGRQLGDNLTDNAYDPDGYRFHDVMHLANAAKLGWSPVLRGMMERKRKSDPTVDEVEDGARAKIVEEAVVKAIHSEGTRIARQRYPGTPLAELTLFPDGNDVTFKFLKLIHSLVAGLEVAKNKYWEWEDSIVSGYKIFHELCNELQGTVTVDLDARSITFRPDVYIDIKGTVSGIGSSLINADELCGTASVETCANEFLTESERSRSATTGTTKGDVARVVAVKRAIFEAVGFLDPSVDDFQKLDVRILEKRRVSIKAADSLQLRIWDRDIVNFKTTLTESHNIVSCTALAISDPGSGRK